MTSLFTNDIITLRVANFYLFFQKIFSNIYYLMKTHVFYEAIHDQSDKPRFFYDENQSAPLHFHRCIEIIYITDGCARCTVDDKTFNAEKNEIIFVQRCAAHAIAPATAYAKFVLIIKAAYTNDFAAALEKKTFAPLLKDHSFNRTLFSLFLRMQRIMQKPSFLVLKGCIDMLVGSLLDHYELYPFTPTPNLSVVIKALDFIDEHFSEPVTLDSLAAHFGYNKYYFSHLFNTYIGENLNNYVNGVRIRNFLEKAKQSNSVNYANLAFDCGFESMTTFHRHFLRIHQKTPSELLGR